MQPLLQILLAYDFSSPLLPVNNTFFVSDDISTNILFVVFVSNGIIGLCRVVVCVALSHILLFIVGVIIAPSQVHHDSVAYPSQLFLMPALKSIARFTLPKQPNLRDGQVTKDFLELVHELNEWHLINFFFGNLPVLNKINI